MLWRRVIVCRAYLARPASGPREAFVAQTCAAARCRAGTGGTRDTRGPVHRFAVLVENVVGTVYACSDVFDRRRS